MKTERFMSVIDEAVDSDFFDATPGECPVSGLGGYPVDECEEDAFADQRSMP
ncbi:MAG: hypothetical protein LBI87_06930 [Candidatus Accumulibacter sp.]|jgi:hypothetical protein|nr:hypothetical protein [Accumulibacter sp.]